jgi:hypothetical protein
MTDNKDVCVRKTHRDEKKKKKVRKLLSLSLHLFVSLFTRQNFTYTMILPYCFPEHYKTMQFSK